MLRDAAEQRRRQYLQWLDIDFYPQALPMTPSTAGSAGVDADSPDSRPPVPAHDGVITAVADPPQTPPVAVPAGQAESSRYSHACLLLCAEDERTTPLLLDILRHVPDLASADDEFLCRHLVTARQLVALRPHLLLTTQSVDQAIPDIDCKQRLVIDLQAVHADPLSAKRQLWKQLQAIALAEHKPD